MLRDGLQGEPAPGGPEPEACVPPAVGIDVRSRRLDAKNPSAWKTGLRAVQMISVVGLVEVLLSGLETAFPAAWPPLQE